MDQKMRNAIITSCVILITTVAVIISAFQEAPLPQQSIPISAKKASAIYQEAVDALHKQPDLSMTVLQTKATTIGTDTFSEESKQEVRYTDLGTENMLGSVDQTLSIGSHTVSILELYAKNTGYFTVQDASFRGSITADAYLDRYVPAAPITFSLYKTITATKTDTETVITFDDATGPEGWLAEELDELQRANGTVYLDRKGNLTRSEFNVAYTKNDMQLHIHIIVDINKTSHIKIQIPEEAAKYKKIQYLDGPRELEIACGYLMIADTASANYTNKIHHQAYGDSRTEKITLNIHKGDTWAARIDTDIVLTNTSLGDAVSRVSQTETFIDGKYTVTLDGVTEELSLDETTMKTLCRDQLVGTILLPQYIKDAKITENEACYRIQFTPTEAFAKIIRSDISQRLYQESDEISQKYKTSKLSCYLDLDLKTRMPTGAGISYSGTYKKDGITYNMSSDTRQTYNILNADSYNAIHKDK